ncbi:MAG: hypothetical protein EBT61_07720 [Verrucomicrobia bacterium]|nr:hypothetical protein [Verrucomicrobiota bacterium]
MTLIETESKVWPVSVTVASANALKHFLHGFAVANPGVVVVHDFNLPGVSAKLVFAGEDVVEHEALGGSFAWVQARPGQWLHPSATIVSDFERSRPITRLSESAFSPRRPARA